MRSVKRKLLVLDSLEKCESTFVLGNDVNLTTSLVEYLQEQIGRTEAFEPSEVIRIGVALHEALTNAIYHGNLEVDSDLRQDDETAFQDLVDQRRVAIPYCDRRVLVTATVSAEEIQVMIRDEGPGFNVRKELAPDRALDLERIGGRGLLLIQSFMDVVYHNALGNEIHLIKYPISSRFRDDLSRADAEAPAISAG